MRPLARYTNWLHTRWPAGLVERLPVVNEDFTTAVPGLFVVGDLTGIPLLKFSADGGARAVRRIAEDAAFGRRDQDAGDVDVAIIGGGVSGMAAALEAHRLGLRFQVIEAAEAFSTIANFPRGKPIYTYPTEMTPAGELALTADVKEELLEELRRQTTDRGIEPRLARVHRVTRERGLLAVEFEADRSGERPPPLTAHRVIIAIGRSGDYRRLDVPGEDDGLVYNRLHDPRDFCGATVVVVGGGDSAIETAVALAACGGHVTLVHRRDGFSRPKPENVARLAALVAPDRRSPLAVDADDLADAEASLPPPAERGRVELQLPARVQAIEGRTVRIDGPDGAVERESDAVFAMIGREPPLAFLRRCGVRIHGDWTAGSIALFTAFLLFCVFLYHWKTTAHELPLGPWFETLGWFPFNMGAIVHALSGIPEVLRRTLAISMTAGGFYYTLAYASCVVIFGIRRIRRRRTPYITRQTLTLMAVQCLPLFLLPELILPALGHAGWLGSRVETAIAAPGTIDAWRAYRDAPETSDAWTTYLDAAGDSPSPLALSPAVASQVPAAVAAWPDTEVRLDWPGVVIQTARGSTEPYRTYAIALDAGRTYTRDDARPSPWVVDQLFPVANYGHGREYWRSYGFVLAWPLFVYNFFTDQPLWLWLAIGFTQTFVVIPLLIRRWGKGAYCGWICSCGALAETLGDAHRTKMPHGPFWNRLNMLGQVILWVAVLLMLLQIGAWLMPGSIFKTGFDAIFAGTVGGVSIPFLNYKWTVDLLLAGIIGVGFYFWFSGRVWCRFACPLAALMHIYTRFSRFRIFADKKKCISCNVCTSVCHQGIDVMSFANKGRPMEDPECVRCSACVQSCPTGVLTFGRLTVEGEPVLDTVAASPVRMREAGARV